MNYSPPIQEEKFTKCQYETEFVNLKQSKKIYIQNSFFWENDNNLAFYIGEINMTTK